MASGQDAKEVFFCSLYHRRRLQHLLWKRLLPNALLTPTHLSANSRVWFSNPVFQMKKLRITSTTAPVVVSCTNLLNTHGAMTCSRGVSHFIKKKSNEISTVLYLFYSHWDTVTCPVSHSLTQSDSEAPTLNYHRRGERGARWIRGLWLFKKKIRIICVNKLKSTWPAFADHA